jgi:ABC-type branched-subunit amino acid transport system permease subunit
MASRGGKVERYEGSVAFLERVAENYRLVIYGFILVAATIFMPRGLVPLVAQGIRALTARLKQVRK